MTLSLLFRLTPKPFSPLLLRLLHLHPLLHRLLLP